jgi:hypothetical protein
LARTCCAGPPLRNPPLYDAIDQWDFCASTTSLGARTFYDQHRAAGDTHHQALQALGNRLVGIRHGCLATTLRTASTPPGPHRQTTPDTKAA